MLLYSLSYNIEVFKFVLHNEFIYMNIVFCNKMANNTRSWPKYSAVLFILHNIISMNIIDFVTCEQSL